MPVGGSCKFLVDHIAEQKKFAAAKERTDHKGGEGGNKYHGDTADDTGHRERQYDADKGLDISRAQIVGGVDHILVDLG